MKALLLLSGGFDSPVAGHLMRERGLDIIAIHFSSEELTDNKEIEKVKTLSRLINCKKLIIVPFSQQQAELVRSCEHRFYFILLRRLMLKVAEKVAEEEDCQYLITGDNLAQVGSQTLSNMANIDRTTKMTILRPILCNDKNETLAVAREIGTFEASKGPEICCLLGPKNPATRSKIGRIEFEESKLDNEKLIETALKEKRSD